VNRPDMNATDQTCEKIWQADWEHINNGATGMWRSCQPEMNHNWQLNYTVIDEVRKLPLKVSDIYRQLSS